MRMFCSGFMILILFASVVFARSFDVNPQGTGDYPTIQDAINACTSGDTILCTAGVFTGEGNNDLVLIGKDIVVIGAGPDVTILKGELVRDPYSGFKMSGGVTRATRVQGLTIRDNSAFWGGGIRLTDGASPVLSNLVIENCFSTGDWYGEGGGMHCYDSSPLLVDVIIRGNHAFWGGPGGMSCRGEGSPELVRVLFEENLGGMACESGITPSFQDVVFRANDFKGLGLNTSWPDTAVIDGIIFDDNIGTGLSVSGSGHFIIRNSVFFSNGSGYGWNFGILASSGTLEIESTTFMGNGNIDPSGGIYLDDLESVSIKNTIFALNGLGPGVLWSGSGATPEFECCDFYGNSGGSVSDNLEEPVGVNGNIGENPLFCGSQGGDDPFSMELRSNSPCLPANNDCGVLMGAFGEGCDAITTIRETPTPESLQLSCNPNPFNPITSLEFEIPEEGPVRLSIYSVEGRLLRTVFAGRLHGGSHSWNWDGKDDTGRPLVSGVYLARLSWNGHLESLKLVLAK